MNPAEHERTAQIREQVRALAHRHAELTRQVDATLVAASHALERARALHANPQSVTRRRPRPPC
jgi:hypothetical protein